MNVQVPIWILVLAGIVFLWSIRELWLEWKEGLKYHPNDDLTDLEFKIEYSLIDEHSELYLIQQIKELRLRPEIDQKRLNELDIIFRQRFQELHINDKVFSNYIEVYSTNVGEHAPDNMNFGKLKKSLRFRQIMKEDEDEIDLSFTN